MRRLNRRTNGVPGGTNDTWCFEVTSTAGLNTFVESQTFVHTNVWYHFAGMRDATNIYLYINGVLEAQTPVTFPQSYGPFPLYFSDTGQSYYDPKFSGALDEVSLYDRALSSNEIYSIYAAGRSGKAKKPTMISPTAQAACRPTRFNCWSPASRVRLYGVQATSRSARQTHGDASLTNVVLSASSNLWMGCRGKPTIPRNSIAC